MKVTILGCGTSVGVPALGSIGWGKCNPNNPLNYRQRSSALVQKDGKNILIDCGPDIRNQLLKTNIKKIDAVLLTHAHSDHITGLPELRPFFGLIGKKYQFILTMKHLIKFLSLLIFYLLRKNILLVTFLHHLK